VGAVLGTVACTSKTSQQVPRTEVPASVGSYLGSLQFEAWQLNQDLVSLIQDASAGFTIDLTSEPANVKISVADSRLNGVLGNAYQYLREAQLSGIGSAMDRRAGPLRERIQEATPEELDLLSGVLGLPPGTERQGVLSEFDGLGPGERNVMRGLIEDEIAARQGEAGIRSLEPEAVQQAIADSSVALGKEAVKLTVGGLTTAAGGQGMQQAMEAVGASEELATAGDLLLTVTDNQPLDQVTREVDVALASDEQTTATIPAPAEEMSPEEAHQALTDTSDLSDDWDALLTLLHDVNLRSPDRVEPNDDGSIDVKVPKRVHFSGLDTAFDQGALTMEVPQMGRAHVMVAPEGKPALITQMETAKETTLIYGEPSAPDAGAVSPRDGGTGSPDSTSGNYPAICQQAIACAKAALDATQAAQFETVFREGGQCFQSPVGADVCAQDCTDAVASWTEDGFC